MNHGTKQRVVGTVVLLALALIFLPFILDGDGDYQPTISSRIPETPAVQIMPEPIPQRPIIEADRFPEQDPEPITELVDDPTPEPSPGQQVEAVTEAGEQVLVQDEPVEETEPALDEMALPEGWSVRLGVFSNPENARNLEARLLSAGYRAYSRELPGPQGPVTGIFVGPQVDRATANRLKVQLQEEFQLAGLVVRFEVESF